MRKRAWMACALSLVLVVASTHGYSRVNAWVEKADVFESNTVHRVIDQQVGDLLHYHYEDANGREVTLPTSARRRSSSYRKAAKIPSVYDPRGTEAETPIRDQTDTGACWAFGALKSLEGNAIAQGLYTTEEADFSECHLAWYTYNRLQDRTSPLYGDYVDFEAMQLDGNIFNIGGNGLLAAFTLANGWGAASESEAPFATGAAMTARMESLGDSIRDHSMMRLTSVKCYDDASRDEIKQAVLDQGAMDVSLYYPYQDEIDKYMYQDEETCSLYGSDYDIDDANHSVTIVGWDDNYNTFCQKPKQSGAWLIANSYGTERNDGGYFWVSYYDTSLCDYYSFQGVSPDTYATTFQYDGFGWGDYMVSEKDIRQANIFTNESDEPQKLSAVSFYTVADAQPYEINIYRNLGTGGPEQGEWVGRCTTKGTADYFGYHTVELEEPIAVAPGERFSAVVTFHPGEDGYTYVAYEGRNSPEFAWHYSGSAGQSYIYLATEGRWRDLAETRSNNVCVKALANPVTAEEYEEQEKNYQPTVPTQQPTQKPIPPVTSAGNGGSVVTAAPGGSGGNGSTQSGGGSTQVQSIQCVSKVVLGIGEKVKLQVQVKPATAKNTVTYDSSHPKIATVQSNGTIRGKKTGTAKITVKASGVKKTVTVKVKKAPQSVKITAGKRTLKKGKKMNLKVKLSKNSASYHLKYQSTNKKVLSVSDQGKVQAKKPGTARIRVTTFNGKKAYIKIKVVG